MDELPESLKDEIDALDSLDAQYDACASYIKSQVGMG